MENQQQRRELIFLHSGDFLLQNSNRVVENSVDHDKSPIKEVDFFSSNNHFLDHQKRNHESLTPSDSSINVRFQKFSFIFFLSPVWGCMHWPFERCMHGRSFKFYDNKILIVDKIYMSHRLDWISSVQVPEIHQEQRMMINLKRRWVLAKELSGLLCISIFYFKIFSLTRNWVLYV